MRLMRQVMPEQPAQEIGKGKAGPGRGNKTADNVYRFGNSETYLLRRLKRERQDLADKVVAGEMSAHAAAVEAGLRPRLLQYAETVEGFLRGAKKHLSAGEREELNTAS